MRFHYSFAVSRLLRELKETGAPLRQLIESLQDNFFPNDVLKVEGYANCYEIFVAGYWIVYEVDQSDRGETVVWVILIEAN